MAQEEPKHKWLCDTPEEVVSIVQEGIEVVLEAAANTSWWLIQEGEMAPEAEKVFRNHQFAVEYNERHPTRLDVRIGEHKYIVVVTKRKAIHG